MPSFFSKNHPKANNQHVDKKHDVGFNIMVIALILLALGIGIAYLIDHLNNNQPSLPSLKNSKPKTDKIIAGQKLSIPSSWFRFIDQRHTKPIKQIDLSFALALGKNYAIKEVNIALMPIKSAISSAILLDSVYFRQFQNEQLKGANGLIGKPLKATEGYMNEAIWYDPISANPFVAKCIMPIAGQNVQKCIRTIYLNNKISATFMFDFELLENWKIFDTEAAKWFAKIDGL